MNRRELFNLILPVAAGAIIAPELLIPKRSFFLPPSGGWAQDPQRLFGYPENTEVLALKPKDPWLSEALSVGDILTFGPGLPAGRWIVTAMGAGRADIRRYQA